MLGKTSSLETFLLCSAALANLSSLVTVSLGPLAASGVLGLLLNHQAAASASVYIQVSNCYLFQSIICIDYNGGFGSVTILYLTSPPFLGRIFF